MDSNSIFDSVTHLKFGLVFIFTPLDKLLVEQNHGLNDKFEHFHFVLRVRNFVIHQIKKILERVLPKMRKVSSQEIDKDQAVLVRKERATKDHVLALWIEILVVEHLDVHLVYLHPALVLDMLIVIRS